MDVKFPSAESVRLCLKTDSVINKHKKCKKKKKKVKMEKSQRCKKHARGEKSGSQEASDSETF